MSDSKKNPKTWAGKLLPAIEAKYAEERMKGPANIEKAMRINKILEALEQEEKLGPTMEEKLRKLERPRKEEEDEDAGLWEKLFGEE